MWEGERSVLTQPPSFQVIVRQDSSNVLHYPSTANPVQNTVVAIHGIKNLVLVDLTLCNLAPPSFIFHANGVFIPISITLFGTNPRLDTSTFSSSGSLIADGLSPAPSSPFSFYHLNHSIIDHYDIFPTTFHDFAPDAGIGDTRSTFLDPEMFPTDTFRGFTCSSYAGDLIFGACTHQPQPSYYGSGFGFETPGLRLSGMQQPSGMPLMQMHMPALPGIGEIKPALIMLNDQVNVPASTTTSEVGIQKDDTETSLNIVSTFELFVIAPHPMEDMVDLAHPMPPAMPLTMSRPMRPLPHIRSSASHG